MRKKRPTEDAAIQHASVWDITAAVAVQAMKMLEHIEYAKEYYEDEVLQDEVQQMHNQLRVLAACCDEYRELFGIMMVELPEGMVGIRIKNPLWNDAAKSIASDEPEDDADDTGDIPW